VLPVDPSLNRTPVSLCRAVFFSNVLLSL
jgi:hypothetical protein